MAHVFAAIDIIAAAIIEIKGENLICWYTLNNHFGYQVADLNIIIMPLNLNCLV
jgi:hypothetical protein